MQRVRPSGGFRYRCLLASRVVFKGVTGGKIEDSGRQLGRTGSRGVNSTAGRRTYRRARRSAVSRNRRDLRVARATSGVGAVGTEGTVLKVGRHICNATADNMRACACALPSRVG